MRARRFALLGAVAACAAILVPAGAQAVLDDTTPPVMTALSVSPATVDVTSGSGDVTFDATITDDLSGVSALGNSCEGGTCTAISQLSLRSPSGQYAWAAFEQLSGDAYRAVATLPQYAEAGTWRVDGAQLADRAGNTKWLTQQDLQSLGLPTTFEVTSVSDTTAPVLGALSLPSGPVDTTSAYAQFDVDATITDDLSGVSYQGNNCTARSCQSPSQASFVSPSGGQSAWGVFEPVSGDAYRAVVTLPRHAEAGTWKLQAVTLADRAGNVKFLWGPDLATVLGTVPTQQVVDANPDTAPPTLSAVTLLTASVDVTSGPGAVNLTAQIADDLSGVSTQGTNCITGAFVCLPPSQIMFSSPSGGQNTWGMFVPQSGDTYSASVTVRQYAEAGLWTVQGLIVADLAGNTKWYSRAELQAQGIDPQIAVSKIASGTADPGGSVTTGGTATTTDPVQATVTTPSGGSIAIQVTPVTQPLPAGYNVLGQQLNITAPPASTTDPLRLVFAVDSSLVPPGGVVDVFRDGSLVQSCTATTPAISPDPCVESETTLAGGDVEVVVLSSHASAWNFAVVTNRPPVCTAVQATPGTIWSPNGKLVTVSLAGATDPDGDAVSLAIAGVTQDEPTAGAPDAFRVAGHPEQVQLRARRDGKGDGRVYRIAFTASDGKGGTCAGTADVGVPHDSSGAAAVRGSASYDSFGS